MIRGQWFSVPFGTGTRAADDTGGGKGLTFHYLRIDGYSVGAALMAPCVTLPAAKDASRVARMAQLGVRTLPPLRLTFMDFLPHACL